LRRSNACVQSTMENKDPHSLTPSADYGKMQRKGSKQTHEPGQ